MPHGAARVFAAITRDGSVHAAAWVVRVRYPAGCEDVGRHNALDKAIGLVRGKADSLRLHADYEPGELRDGAEVRHGRNLFLRRFRSDAFAVRMQETGMTLGVRTARPARGLCESRAIEIQACKNIDLLIKMANQIRLLGGSSAGRRRDRVATHLRRYWEPRMRAQMITYCGGSQAPG